MKTAGQKRGEGIFVLLALLCGLNVVRYIDAS